MKFPINGLRGDALREAVSEFRAIIDLVREALKKRLYPTQADSWVDLEAIYSDRVVFNHDGKKWQMTYVIAADNTVTLGDAVQVMEEFVPIKEANAPKVSDGVFIEAKGDVADGKWLIRVVKAGVSGNKNFYSDAVLREAAPMFNGARVFNKADDEHLKGDGKAFNNLIGGLSDAVFVEGKQPDTGEIQAVLTLIEPAGTVAVKIRESYQRDLSNLFGFSIDADGKTKSTVKGGVRIREAVKFLKVNSVDLIVEPGAGGQLIRMVESINPIKEQDTMRTRMFEAVIKHNPKKFDGKSIDEVTDDELDAAYREALAAESSGGNQNSIDDVQAVLREARMLTATTKINASNLPDAAKKKLIADFNNRDRFVEADIESAIKSERDYLSHFVESGHINIQGLDIQVGDRHAQINDMLDAFFDPAHKNHRDVGSFKECYIEITGDKNVTGLLRNCDQARLRESLGQNFRESLDTSSFADVLGNSITRRMQAIYTGMTDLQSWRKVASVGRVNDFRTQEVGRVGGYGNLPLVGEGDPYQGLTSPGDDKSTWAVAKRGGTEDVTLEMIKNDDVRAISRIPQELALAAGNTLYEFVFDFFRLNPNGWDGVAIYHASHGNLFTGALSANEFAAHRLAMQKQTRAGSGKRLGTEPGIVMVPFDLQSTAYDLFVRNQNLDKTFIQSINPMVLPVSSWTDATDWVTIADPARFPVLEIDFLDGQEEPELFIQDTPNQGSMFTNDKATYKVRHIYGGNFLVDAEKGTTKAVVAG